MKVEWVRSYLGHQAAVYALLPGRTAEEGFLSAGGEGWIARWLVGKDDGHLVGKADTSLFGLAQMDDRLAVGGLDARLYLIDEQNNQVRALENHRKGIYRLYRNGPNLISLGADGNLTCWSSQEWLPEFTLKISHHALRSFARMDEDRLWVGSSDGNIYLVNLYSGQVLQQIKAHEPSVFSLVYDPVRELLISGGRDAQIKQWDARTGRLIQVVPAHWYTVNELLLHPTQSLLASASRDRTIKLWDPVSLELIKVIETPKFPGHIRSVNTLAWLDEETLLSGGDDRSIIEWKISN